MIRLVGLLAALAGSLALLVSASSAAVGQDSETFTVVVIPDTQIYVQTESGTEFFADQLAWVADQQSERNIVFMSHVGDVSQNPSSVVEWDRIETVYETIDVSGIAHGISPGNHDIELDGSAPEYDARFGVDRYVDADWFAGHHEAEGNRSSYQTIAVEGHELLFLHVRHLQPQYGDVDAVLAWTDSVLSDHPDHLVFVTTHEFTETDGTVRKPELQQVIQDHCNVVTVSSGHRLGVGRGSFVDACGRTVHHVLTNYQGIQDGGQGFLRTIEIDRLTLDASFEVYSPTLDEFRTGETESFSAPFAPLALVPGDASCNRNVSVTDALFAAQLAVGVRVPRLTCPLPDPAFDANATSADANNDGRISSLDALLIAQCSAQLTNALCPT